MRRLFLFAILLLAVARHTSAAIVLTSTTGTEGRSSQTTTVRIDEQGKASTTMDFTISGSTSNPNVHGTKFGFTIDAISEANTTSGSKHTDGIIDRDNSGKLGVRGGSSGINEREGLLLGLDAAGLNPRVGWQLTGIQVAYVGDGESYLVVNRSDPKKRLSGDTDGMIDVSGLGLFVRGGTADRELASVFAGDDADPKSSGFRIVAFRFAAGSNPVTLREPSKNLPRMRYADHVSGRPLSKDPAVVRFKGRYWLYYSIPPYRGKTNQGWTIGVATSDNLVDWTKAGELQNTGAAEANGFTAPGAIVLQGKVHLFYQTYGNQEKDAICHAWSTDGLNFTRNSSNPIFRPTGDWNSGRAIDADVIPHRGQLLLYWATRDPTMKIQMQGVAAAPIDSDFSSQHWKQLNPHGPILSPQIPTKLDDPGLNLAWEKKCIEAAAMARHDGRLYMFYAGGYNNDPQQIGVAVSEDGVKFKRLSDRPILPNGPPGSWNSSESGHPFLFQDDDGKDYLFYQGNDTQGRSWHLSVVPIDWKNGQPTIGKMRIPSK
jgi:beta-1,2-mannobiose phosphorylase / 1,2-beta-oligomannan phosphorylase